MKNKGIIGSVIGFLNRTKKDHVGAYAAQCAYFIILSFIPFVLCLMTIAQKTTALTEGMVRQAILQIFPENFEGFITEIINEVYSKSSAVIPVTAVTALWSAGKGLQSLTNGLNTIYHVKETRNWLLTRIRSVFYTLIFVIALMVSLLLLVFGNNLQRTISKYAAFLAELIGIILGARTFLVFAVLMLVFLCLFRFLPNRKATFKSQLPGAALTAVAWMAFSYGFSLYFTYFSFSNMYGSLTTIMLLMIWMYICMTIVLYGAEVNAYYEKQFRQAHAFARDLFEKEEDLSDLLEEEFDDFFKGEDERNKKRHQQK